MSQESRDKMRASKVGNTNAWKGDAVTYGGIHWWVNKYFVRPKFCEDCGTTKAKRYEWANISGLYKRVRSDWKNLCTKCHHKMDKIAERGWATKKQYAKALV